MTREASGDNWGDGRLVLRRPEARNSAVAKCYIPQTAQEAEELARTLEATVSRRRALSEKQRAEQLTDLAALVKTR
jgi:hypothetical protein